MKEVVQSGTHNNQLLYFTSSSLSADDQKLFFISDRTGDPNVFVKDLISGTEKCLTQNSEGYLKSYVYFDGNPYKGFGKASVSLDAGHEIIYYIQGNHICKVGVDGKITVLNDIRNGEMTAFTHVSKDGKLLCVPTTDGRALDYDAVEPNQTPDYDIDKRVCDEKLNSYINVYDTETGALILREAVNSCWITHVQFSPSDNGLILYNHEWPHDDAGTRRMWLWNSRTKAHTKLRTKENVIKPEGWACHEMYKDDGTAIIYHGRYDDDINFVGKIDTQDISKLTEIPFDKHFTKYGHFTANNDGLLVTDGYYQRDNESTPNAKYISTLSVDWEKGNIIWKEICAHNSTWKNQDCHPHPIFNHKGDEIYFTSDFTGKCGIYRSRS